MEEHSGISYDAQVTVYTFLIVVIVGANLAVILLMFKRRQINVTKMFLIAISASNILIGPLTISLEIYGLLARNSITIPNCFGIIYFEMTCFMANMYTIVVFILEMYRTIVVKHKRTYSKTRVIIVIILVWTGSFIFAAKTFFAIGNVVESEPLENLNMDEGSNASDIVTHVPDSSNDDDAGQETSAPYIMCSYLMEESQDDLLNRYVDLVVILFIPQTICTVCLFKLRSKLWSPAQGINTTLKQRRKLVKLLCGLLVTNITCWMPLTISDIIIDTVVLHLNQESAEELESSSALSAVKFSFAVLALCSLSINAIFMIYLKDRITSLLEMLDLCCPRYHRNKVEPADNCSTFVTNYELCISMTGNSNNCNNQTPLPVTI